MRDSSYVPRIQKPLRFRRELIREEQEQKRQGPPKPPKRKGPELRGPGGKLKRALVQNTTKRRK